MSSKKRRRLYEGFGVLNEEKPLNPEGTEITRLSDDNHMINVGKSYDPKDKIEPVPDESSDNHMTNHMTDVGQSYDNHMIKFDWFSFSKLQQKILFSLFKSCKFSGSLITDPIRATELSEDVKSPVLSVRRTLFNIQKLGAIKRHSFKDGPGGYTRYILNKSIYDILLLEEAKNGNHMIIIGKSYDNPMTQPMKNEPNSISINKKNTSILIPENLKTLISKNEISDLIQKELMEEADLKESLEHFSYDLANNLVRAKTNPINLFFGLTRTGKKYRSLTLIEQQNNDLRAYQKQLEVLEAQEKELKQKALKHKFEEFKAKNPSFIEKVALENPMASEPSVIENLAFQQFVEKNA